MRRAWNVLTIIGAGMWLAMAVIALVQLDDIEPKWFAWALHGTFGFCLWGGWTAGFWDRNTPRPVGECGALREINSIIFGIGAPLGTDEYFRIREICAKAERAGKCPAPSPVE